MFDFQVKYVVRFEDGRGGWIVSLPHQCDAWDIAGDDSDGVPHAQAVTDLEVFIAEAQAALVKLKAEDES